MAAYSPHFARFYDSFVTRFIEGDIPFYLAQARALGDPVLDLACGTGRVTLPLAQAGCIVVGLDNAPAMLHQARQKRAALDPRIQARITLRRGDMRDFDLDQQFRLILIPCGAFLHLLTPADQQQALGCIYRHLHPNGRLIIQIVEPSAEQLAAWRAPLGHAYTQVETFAHPERGTSMTLSVSTCFSAEDRRFQQAFRFEEHAADGACCSRKTNHITFCYISGQEMSDVLTDCGFHTEAVYGDFAGGQTYAGSERIWIVRKA